jgi:hypothetical protein
MGSLSLDRLVGLQHHVALCSLPALLARSLLLTLRHWFLSPSPCPLPPLHYHSLSQSPASVGLSSASLSSLWVSLSVSCREALLVKLQTAATHECKRQALLLTRPSSVAGGVGCASAAVHALASCVLLLPKAQACQQLSSSGPLEAQCAELATTFLTTTLTQALPPPQASEQQDEQGRSAPGLVLSGLAHEAQLGHVMLEALSMPPLSCASRPQRQGLCHALRRALEEHWADVQACRLLKEEQQPQPAQPRKRTGEGAEGNGAAPPTSGSASGVRSKKKKKKKKPKQPSEGEDEEGEEGEGEGGAKQEECSGGSKEKVPVSPGSPVSKRTHLRPPTAPSSPDSNHKETPHDAVASPPLAKAPSSSEEEESPPCPPPVLPSWSGPYCPLLADEQGKPLDLILWDTSRRVRERLSLEMEDMAQGLARVAARRRPWQLCALTRLEQLIHKTWPHATMHVYGTRLHSHTELIELRPTQASHRCACLMCLSDVCVLCRLLHDGSVYPCLGRGRGKAPLPPLPLYPLPSPHVCPPSVCL